MGLFHVGFLVVTVLLAVSPARARKEIPIAPLFPSPVLEVLQCDVCAYALANFQQQLHVLREDRRAKQQVVHEDDMLEVLDTLCNPMTEGGEWIRRVVVKWESPSEPLLTDVTMHFNTCTSTCRSVSEACDRVLDMEEAEAITSIFLGLVQDESVSLMNITISNAVARTICSRGRPCADRESRLAELSKQAEKDPHLFETVTSDAPKEIDQQEVDMERMMYNMWEKDGKKTDVFDRDEIRQLQEAIARGDREEARRLDPATMDLSDDEFEELRQMYLAGDLRGMAGRDPPSELEDL